MFLPRLETIGATFFLPGILDEPMAHGGHFLQANMAFTWTFWIKQISDYRQFAVIPSIKKCYEMLSDIKLKKG